MDPLEDCDIKLSEYSNTDLQMHYQLCLTTLNHFKKIMEENPVLGEQEQMALTICLTEAQNDVNECEAEMKGRENLKDSSDK